MTDKKERLNSKLASLQQMSAAVLKDTEYYDLRDIVHAMQKKFPEQLQKCIDKGKQTYASNPNRNFYIVSHVKVEWFNPRLWKQQFVATLECPRPYLNFSVYKYHRKTDLVEELWWLPDRQTLEFYYQNRHLASPEEQKLVQYCVWYKDGTLYKRMQHENGESPDKPFLLAHDLSQFKKPDEKGTT